MLFYPIDRIKIFYISIIIINDGYKFEIIFMWCPVIAVVDDIIIIIIISECFDWLIGTPR